MQGGVNWKHIEGLSLWMSHKPKEEFKSLPCNNVIIMPRKTTDNGKRLKERRRLRLIRKRLEKTGGVEDDYIRNLRGR